MGSGPGEVLARWWLSGALAVIPSRQPGRGLASATAQRWFVIGRLAARPADTYVPHSSVAAADADADTDTGKQTNLYTRQRTYTS